MPSPKAKTVPMAHICSLNKNDKNHVRNVLKYLTYTKINAIIIIASKLIGTQND